MFCLYRIHRLSRSTDDAALRQLTNRGLVCYVAALLWWGLDIGMCDVFYVQWGLPNLQVRAGIINELLLRPCVAVSCSVRPCDEEEEGVRWLLLLCDDDVVVAAAVAAVAVAVCFGL